VDPESRSPQHDDQAAQPASMAPVTGRAHDGEISSTVGGSAG